MRALIDTCTFLWVDQQERARLSAAALAVLDDTESRFVLSAASVWEMSIKISKGKLMLRQPLEVALETKVRSGFLSILNVDETHALRVATLPHFHRDPFDRMLVAQCLVEGLPVISPDRKLDGYGVIRVWE